MVWLSWCLVLLGHRCFYLGLLDLDVLESNLVLLVQCWIALVLLGLAWYLIISNHAPLTKLSNHLQSIAGLLQISSYWTYIRTQQRKVIIFIDKLWRIVLKRLDGCSTSVVLESLVGADRSWKFVRVLKLKVKFFVVKMKLWIFLAFVSVNACVAKVSCAQ